MGGGEVNSANTSDSGVGNGIAINIRCSNGVKLTVRTGLESTVGAFKALIAQNCDIPANQQRLIYKGRILKDDQTLGSYGLEEEHAVHLVRGFVPDTSANSTSAGTPGSIAPNGSPGITTGVGSNENQSFGGGLGASLFPGLGGSALGGSGPSGLFGSGLPTLEEVQQQISRNPSMINEIMNMPAIQNMLNNPDLIRNLMMNNPRMREVIDRNPELAHILNDPNTLRQTMETARNPELMREMMRNTDRAMSNIESLPEGFNMLRRMYENVQEPLLSATTMAGNDGNGPGSNPFAALLGTQAGSQVEDLLTNPSSVVSDANTGSSVPNSNPLPNPWSSTGATGGTQTNAATRTNPAGGGNVLGIGGFGALDLPGLDTPSGGMPDPSTMIQFLQNPAVSQIMQSLTSNPQYMNLLLTADPEMRGMLDSNPQMRDALQNPDFLRQMSSPERMQQILALSQSLSSLFGPPSQPSPLETGQTGRATVPPEELYANQLSQLQEMGFIDTRENIQALLATSGNVHAAVERLLQNLGQ